MLLAALGFPVLTCGALEHTAYERPAPPCPPAALRLVVHRAEPKLVNPNGPCSTMLEVDPNTDVDSVLALASSRLGVPFKECVPPLTLL